MGQLEPLEHHGNHGNVDPTDDCPACALVTETFNDMSRALEKASRQLPVSDLAFVVALLVHSIMEAAPTEDARVCFAMALADHSINLRSNPPQLLTRGDLN